jgi:gamma-glutamyltranspeptidase/glutathione hydrolase
VGLPHLSMRSAGLAVEKDPPLPWPIATDSLVLNDQPMRRQRLGSGTALLQWIDGRWHGAADPRREGTALAIP